MAFPPLLDDFVINIPGGIGVPDTKLMFALIKLLIVVQAVARLTGEFTLPFTITEQLFPVMAKAGMRINKARNEALERQSFLNISSTYRLNEKKFRMNFRKRGDETLRRKAPYP